MKPCRQGRRKARHYDSGKDESGGSDRTDKGGRGEADGLSGAAGAAGVGAGEGPGLWNEPFGTDSAAVLDTGRLAETLSGKDISSAVRSGTIRSGITKALELVGPKTLSDTLRCVKKGGVVCNTGILGGMYTLNNFDPIKGIPNGVYLTGFYSNGPTQEITDEIFTFLTAYHLQPCVGRRFDFSDIREAWLAQDRGAVNGKIVVRLTDHG